MRIIAIFIATFMLLVAGSASAQHWYQGKTTSDRRCSGPIRPGQTCYFPMSGTSTTDSVVKQITAEYATVCFEPDDASTGAATGQVQIMWTNAEEGTTGDANDGNAILNETLTGAAGDDCIYDVPTGTVWVNITIALGAGIDGYVSITGGEAPR
jgi:hypothetical protein